MIFSHTFHSTSSGNKVFILCSKELLFIRLQFLEITPFIIFEVFFRISVVAYHLPRVLMKLMSYLKESENILAGVPVSWPLTMILNLKVMFFEKVNAIVKSHFGGRPHYAMNQLVVRMLLISCLSSNYITCFAYQGNPFIFHRKLT